MTNKRYRAGRDYEYKVKHKLEEEGWTVLRTAGSHGIFDLVAIYALPYVTSTITKGAIKLIQCKTGKSKKRAISEVEKSDIKKWEGLYAVSVEVV